MPLASVEILASLLRQCRKDKSISVASLLQSYLCRSGLTFQGSMETILISMLVEVGIVSNAGQILDQMVYEGKVGLLNSLITDYAKCGEVKHALFLYTAVKHGVHLYPQTYVALLKACAELQDVERGREIHVGISRHELDRDLFVGSALVNLYVKCSLLEEAREIFDRLLARDIVSWNALIAAYVKHGFDEKALNLLDQMQGQGIPPNTVTFVCTLKACASLREAGKGQELHAEIARKGLFKQHHFVGNALINMYAKCGLLAQAQEVFDELSVRDSVSWNAIAVGFANYGHLLVALDCLEEMISDGATPSIKTFLCILKACSTFRTADVGQEVHAEIARTGLLENDLVTGNTLVDMYASSGLLKQAEEVVLHELPFQNVVTWTILISSFIKYEHCEEALDCYKKMQQKGVSPNEITYICCLKACSNMRALDEGQELHDKIASLGLLERNLSLGNALLDMYANCGFLSKLQEVFDKLPHKDIVSWTTLIMGYMNREHGEEALRCFEQMQLEGISPDAVAYTCALNTCASIGAAERGMKIHDEISKEELLERDLVIGNALIDMYASCGLLSKAQAVFNNLPLHDVVSWTALIAGYAKNGYDEEVLICIDQMQHDGIFLDDFVLVYGLQVCGSIGAIAKGWELHHGVLDTRLPKCYLLVGNALVDMYAKCGLLANAQEVFNALSNKDEVTWNALITGYAQLGEISSVFLCINRMVIENKKPNVVTLVSLLTACSHAGLVKMAEMLFEVVIKEHDIIPTLEHYICMIDLLGRAGQLGKMLAKVERMPFHPNLVVWHSLLGAGKKWGNVELGQEAFVHALQVDKYDTGSFVCISNIYSMTLKDQGIEVLGPI